MKLYVHLTPAEEAVVEIRVSNGFQPAREPTGAELIHILHQLNKACRFNDPATNHVTTTSRLDDIIY